MSTNREEIGKALARMLAAFPSQDPGVSATLRLAAYADAVGGYEAEIVREAVMQVIRGTVAEEHKIDPQYAPSPPQLANLIRSIADRRRRYAELRTPQKLLPEREPSEAERARVAQGFDDLKAELRGQQPAKWFDQQDSLKQRAMALGLNFDATMAALPDAPARKGEAA